MSFDPASQSRRVFALLAQRCRERVATTGSGDRAAQWVSVRRLVEFCETDPLVAEVLAALVSEATTSFAALEERRRDLAAEVCETATAYEHDHPAVREAALGPWTWPGVIAAACDAANQPVRRPPHGIRGDAVEMASNLKTAAAGIHTLVARDARDAEASQESVATARLLSERAEWLVARHKEWSEHDPGYAWLNLRELPAVVDAEPGTLTGPQAYEPYMVRDDLWQPRLRADVRREVDLIADELEIRLGTRVVHDVAMQRYARAAMTFRRRSLARRADGPAAEAVLRDDVADYLFARGIDVLTEVVEGVVRHDLRDLGTTILVEAKCVKGANGQKRQLINGCRQLVDYLGRLDTAGQHPDPFLVVFRLSGPRLSVPGVPVHLGKYAVRVVVIDLVEADEAGSHASDSVEIGAADLAEGVRALPTLERRRKVRSSKRRR